MLTPNEFYVSSMMPPIRNIPLSIAHLNSSRMVCLNCSKCHAEMQDSCVQHSVYKRQKSRSHSPRIPSNQPVSTANIPSLLDFPLPRPNKRSRQQHTRSSKLSDPDNETDCT